MGAEGKIEEGEQEEGAQQAPRQWRQVDSRHAGGLRPGGKRRLSRVQKYNRERQISSVDAAAQCSSLMRARLSQA